MLNNAKEVNGKKPLQSELAKKQYRQYCLGLAFVEDEKHREHYLSYLEEMGAYYGLGFEESKRIVYEVEDELRMVKALVVFWMFSPAK